MFCPECGSKCEEGNIICSRCGFSFAKNNSIPSPMDPEKLIPGQEFSGNIPGDDPLIKDQPLSEHPADTMPLYLEHNAPGMDMSVEKPKKRFPLKPVLIAAISLTVVAAGVFGFFMIKKAIEKKFISENPTKSVINGYQTYLESCEGDSDLFKLLKSSKDAGYVKVSVDGKSGSENVSGDAAFSIDKTNNKYYMAVNSGNLPGLSDGQKNKDTKAEVYTDLDKLYFNYDLSGTKGCYYIDAANFRKSITDSIFSPEKENVLGMTSDEFNSTVDAFEKSYKEMKDTLLKSDKKEEKIDNILKTIENNANVSVGEEKTTVNGKNVNTYTVTYTLDQKAIENLAADLKKEYLRYVDENKVTVPDPGGNKKSVGDSLDNIQEDISSDKYKNISLVIKNYLDQGSKEIVKAEVTLDAGELLPGSLKLDLEFSKNPHININATLTFSTQGFEIAFTSSFKKEVSGDNISYKMEAGLNMGVFSQKYSASVNYNKSTKAFSAEMKDPYGNAFFSLKGTADIGSEKAKFRFEDLITSDDTKLNLTLELSSKPVHKSFKESKDFFGITKEEYDKLSKELSEKGSELVPKLPGQTDEAYSGTEYPDADAVTDTVSDTDTDVSYATVSEAKSIENACKVYYSGVRAGTINSKNFSSDINLPAPDASKSQREAAARKCYVYYALSYCNLSSLSDKVSTLRYDRNGKIYSQDDPDVKLNMNKLNVFTSFATLYSDY